MWEAIWVSKAAGSYRAGRSLALFFDYDGTLTPIVSYPRQAILPLATRDLLAAFSGRARVRVGILSGRSLGSLKELIGLPHILYAGSGGMQIDLGSTIETDPSLS